jgi:hypothetical protein
MSFISQFKQQCRRSRGYEEVYDTHILPAEKRKINKEYLKKYSDPYSTLTDKQKKQLFEKYVIKLGFVIFPGRHGIVSFSYQVGSVDQERRNEVSEKNIYPYNYMSLESVKDSYIANSEAEFFAKTFLTGLLWVLKAAIIFFVIEAIGSYKDIDQFYYSLFCMGETLVIFIFFSLWRHRYIHKGRYDFFPKKYTTTQLSKNYTINLMEVDSFRYFCNCEKMIEKGVNKEEARDIFIKELRNKNETDGYARTMIQNFPELNTGASV